MRTETLQVEIKQLPKADAARWADYVRQYIVKSHIERNYPGKLNLPLVNIQTDVQYTLNEDDTDYGVTVDAEVRTWTVWWQWPWRLFWLPICRATTASDLAKAGWESFLSAVERGKAKDQTE